MRTLVSLLAVGIAVVLVAVVFSSATSADQVVGPLSGTLSSTSTFGNAGPHDPMFLLVKGPHGHHGHHGNFGHHGFGNNWWFGYPGYGYGYGYPDYSWDYDSSSSGNQTCVWNGYDYTCYQPSDAY